MRSAKGSDLTCDPPEALVGPRPKAWANDRLAGLTHYNAVMGIGMGLG